MPLVVCGDSLFEMEYIEKINRKYPGGYALLHTGHDEHTQGRIDKRATNCRVYLTASGSTNLGTHGILEMRRKMAENRGGGYVIAANMRFGQGVSDQARALYVTKEIKVIDGVSIQADGKTLALKLPKPWWQRFFG